MSDSENESDDSRSGPSTPDTPPPLMDTLPAELKLKIVEEAEFEDVLALSHTSSTFFQLCHARRWEVRCVGASDQSSRADDRKSV